MEELEELVLLKKICSEYGIPYLMVEKSCDPFQGKWPRWNGSALELTACYIDYHWLMVGLHEVAHWLLASPANRLLPEFGLEEAWEEEMRVWALAEELKIKYIDQAIPWLDEMEIL